MTEENENNEINEMNEVNEITDEHMESLSATSTSSTVPVEDEEISEDNTENTDEKIKQLEELLEIPDDNNNEDDGLMNVNVKERRQCFLQMLNHHVLKSAMDLGQNATMSRMATKNAAVVKMAVHNLNNLKNRSSSLEQTKDNVHEKSVHENLETESIIAMEGSSKVKLMVSKFDPTNNVAA